MRTYCSYFVYIYLKYWTKQRKHRGGGTPQDSQTGCTENILLFFFFRPELPLCYNSESVQQRW